MFYCRFNWKFSQPNLCFSPSFRKQDCLECKFDPQFWDLSLISSSGYDTLTVVEFSEHNAGDLSELLFIALVLVCWTLPSLFLSVNLNWTNFALTLLHVIISCKFNLSTWKNRISFVVVTSGKIKFGSGGGEGVGRRLVYLLGKWKENNVQYWLF